MGAIEIARATCVKGCRGLARNPASVDDALEKPADLEWRDSAEAARVGLLLTGPEGLPERGSKDPFLSGGSEAARP